TDHQQVLPH
ncbi:putative cytochrome c oxidase subunit 3, partial [Chlamydia psittaci 09DC77]